MRFILDIFTVILVSAGAFFFLAGTVGLLRFPDTLTRLHALTKADNLGLGLVVIGLLPQTGGLYAAKLIGVWLLVLVASSAVSQTHRSCGQTPHAAEMTIAPALYIAPAVLVLALAGWTLLAQDDFAAIVGFVTYGLLLSLVWVSLSSLDIALTEAAIGSGVTGVLLLGAGARLRSVQQSTGAERPGIAQRVSAAALCTLVSVGLALSVFILPEHAPTLAPSAAANLAATGMSNPVSAVLLAYRALDTVLESAVLPLALIGVWSLAPDRFWGGRPGFQHRADREGVLERR
jgi:monovalent cation/proton antiporter MnhG/PhaG subunit